MRQTALAVAAVLLAASAAHAQTPSDDTDWTSVVTPTGPVIVPNTPEGAFSNPEGIRFVEQQRKGALDQVCRGLDLAINESLSRAGATITGGVSRSLKPLPSGQLALVDEDHAQVSLGRSLWAAVVGGAANAAGVNITVNAALDGTSLVVRPLANNNACAELKRLIEVTDIKTVVPLDGRRISSMEVGELWKLPLALSIGGAPTAQYRDAVVSFGLGETGSAMMTLYRIAPDKVRFRLRVDHVRVHGPQGGVVASYPAVVFFGAGVSGIKGMLERVVSHALADQLSAFISGEFSGGRPVSDGQQVVMEFVLDPRDEAQMQTLAHSMRGDFKTLAEMALRMTTFQATIERSRRDFVELESEHEEKLGEVAAAPGIDLYHQVQKNLRLRLPLIIDHIAGSNEGDDRYISLAPGGDQVHLYHEDSTRTNNYVNLPIKGAMIKRDELRSAQAFVRTDGAGVQSDPQAVYIYHEGFLRKDADDVREMAQNVSRLLSRTGTKGGEPDPRLALPIDRLVPEHPKAPVERDRFGEFHQAPPVSYHNGSLSLTLVLTAKAVADIVRAEAPLVAKCVRVVLDDDQKAMLDFAMSTAGFDAEGRLRYDQKKFYAAYGSDNLSRSTMERVVDTTTGLVQDLRDVAAQPDKEARAQSVARLLAGHGRSGLDYEKVLEVLVQLAEPKDVTADFRIDVNKKVEGEQDAHAHLVLSKGRAANPELLRAGELKQRFARPSDLVD